MSFGSGKRRQRGFTLLELLAAAAILGILASVAVPVVQTTVRREKERELRLALRDIRSAIDAYKAASVAGRIETGINESGYPPRLQDLAGGIPVKDKSGALTIYFLRRLPRDPFADRSIAAADTWVKRSFDSSPDAPREGADVFDVASRSPLMGLNGVPYAQW
ncbi:type II secretion system protein [Janthinobacterium sp. SUN100]|uniref:type II secretion system protein n=1 Tax=Janthinobacterium sp. SUN100 TaxID=3004101 RepID=UPI0025AFBA2D|nr:type II secretion system protein [Janthinobacterium sp. SUN100]MDN2700401.1 type II secretion system protein [Janthinobacterium sp. SUN100]